MAYDQMISLSTDEEALAKGYLLYKDSRYKISRSGIQLLSPKDVEYAIKQVNEYRKIDSENLFTKLKKLFRSSSSMPINEETLYKSHKIDLNIDMTLLRTCMNFANEAYSGQFSAGNMILASEKNDLSKPQFYCIENMNNIFIATKGSDTIVDGATDAMFHELSREFWRYNYLFPSRLFTSCGIRV